MQYNPDFLIYRPILTASQKERCDKLLAELSLEQLLDCPRNYQELQIDFIHVSAKIEGNTYDRADTDCLLKMGITAGGKKYSDAVMILNLRKAYDNIMLIGKKQPIDKDYLCSLHAELMQGLLPNNELGIIRRGSVVIGASKYKPLSDINQLSLELLEMLKTASEITNPLEKAIYLHCNTAYLQYFRDGNKRLARMLQTAALLQNGLMPVFFQEKLISEYIRALIDYYETGDYANYLNFIIASYEAMLEK